MPLVGNLKEYFDKLSDEDKAAIDRLKRWDEFYELNPSLCPHTSVMAAVAEDGAEHPGICLTCGRDDITTSLQGDYPDHEPPTVKTISTAHTVTTAAKWSLEPSNA